jgi:hypothetical protein
VGQSAQFAIGHVLGALAIDRCEGAAGLPAFWSNMARGVTYQSRKRSTAPFVSKVVVSGTFKKTCGSMPPEPEQILTASRTTDGWREQSRVRTRARQAAPGPVQRKQCLPSRTARHSNCRVDRPLPSGLTGTHCMRLLRRKMRGVREVVHARSSGIVDTRKRAAIANEAEVEKYAGPDRRRKPRGVSGGVCAVAD